MEGELKMGPPHLNKLTLCIGQPSNEPVGKQGGRPKPSRRGGYEH